MSDVFEITPVDDDDTGVEPSITTPDRYNLRKNPSRNVFNTLIAGVMAASMLPERRPHKDDPRFDYMKRPKRAPAAKKSKRKQEQKSKRKNRRK